MQIKRNDMTNMTKLKPKPKPKNKKTKKIIYEMILNQHAPAVEYYGDSDKWTGSTAFKKKAHGFKEFILGEGPRMLGLAANQVKRDGVRLDEPFIAIKNPNGGCNVYIDPVISEYIGKSQDRQEFPLTHAKCCIIMPRHNKVIATWYNPMGGKRTGVELVGLLAQAFQHMVDRLHGIEYKLLPYGHIHSGRDNAKRNDPCPCGSKIKCKLCCGVVC